MAPNLDPQPEPVIADRLRGHPRAYIGVWALSTGMVAIFLYLLYRNMGLYPVVMADEWACSLYSRLLPFSKSSIPSYLFFWIFKQTNHCGGSYTDCARFFNSIFFVGSAPLIYAVSRRIVQPAPAAFIALLTMLGPVNTYTAYFMPEAMYFWGFWVLSWFLLTFRKSNPLCYGGIIGVILAGLSMIKVHAIFLIPGVAAGIIASTVRCEGQNRTRFQKAILTFVCAGLTAISARLLIGYLFAGNAGLHVLGQKYGAVAHSSLTAASLLRLTHQVAFVLKGHILGLALLFGVPLASLATWQRSNGVSSQGDDFLVIRIYALAMLAFLLLVTAYYTASVDGQPHEAIGRMHLRYYNFVLPLLLIVVAGEWVTAMRPNNLYVTLPLGALIAGLAAYSVKALKTQYAPNCIDSPEVRAAFYSNRALHAIVFLGLAALAVWALNRRRGAQIFLFVVLPVSVLVMAHFANKELRDHLHPSSYEQAGRAAHDILTRQERSKLAVVGSDDVALYKSLYQIDSAEATMVVIPEGAALEMRQLPAQADWIVVVGNHAVPKELELQFPRSGYALFRREDSTP